MRPGGRQRAGGARIAGVCLGSYRHWKRTFVQDMEERAKEVNKRLEALEVEAWQAECAPGNAPWSFQALRS